MFVSLIWVFKTDPCNLIIYYFYHCSDHKDVLYAVCKEQTAIFVQTLSILLNLAATWTSDQAKRKVKQMDRLDVNVEFNNEGDECTPRARAPHREETGIESIRFFEVLVG